MYSDPAPAPFLTRHRLPLALGAAVLFALLLVDELAFGDEPFTPRALVFELIDLGLLIGCTVASVLLTLQGRVRAEENSSLREALDEVRDESARWRERMAAQLQGFGRAIQEQLLAWRLSRAEQDVALLLLKGFSHKEIARLRKTGEATIRQQAGAIYAKADVGGRAGLAAYFLDGLHLPEPDAAEDRPRVTNGFGPGPI